ncbi:dsDNA nuclease domain-containing protein [Streptomyces sp. NPDC004051]
MTDPINIVAPDDSGSMTQQRFEFQAHAALRPVLQMLGGMGVRHVTCEHIEDIVVASADPDGLAMHWDFQQIKTRDGNESWTLARIIKAEPLRSLWRTHQTLKGSGLTYQLTVGLEGQLQKSDDVKALASGSGGSRAAVVQQIGSHLNVSDRALLVEFLGLVRMEELPRRGELELRNWKALQDLAPDLTGGQVDALYERLLQLTHRAMQGSAGPNWPTMVAVPDPTEQILRKRITLSLLAEEIRRSGLGALCARVGVVDLPGRAGGARSAGLPLQVGLIPVLADDFQGRAVQGLLRSGATADGQQVYSHVLAGMGGTGKSQVAAHHADWLLRQGKTDLVVWANAASVEGIRGTFGRAAAMVGAVEAGNLETAPTAFVEWLGTAGCRWLIVLDDLRDPLDMRGLWPPKREAGQVVITTRRRDPGLRSSMQDLIEFGPFSPGQSSAYLSRRFATHRLSEPPEEIASLAEELGHLPLALAQAASYVVDLSDAGMTVARYRDLLNRRLPLTELSPSPAALPDGQSETLARVLGLSLERADEVTSGLATPILQLASFLDPSGFPASVLTTWRAITYLSTALNNSRSWTEHVRADDVTQAMRTLSRLSLVNLSPVRGHAAGHRSEDLVAVHALTQHAAYDTIPRGWHGVLGRTVGGALSEVWPEDNHDGDITRALLTSAFRLESAVGEEDLWDPDCDPQFLLKASRSLGESGEVSDAVARFGELATTAAHWFEPEDTYTLSARHGHAFWRCEAGDPAGAAKEFAELAAVRMRVLGPDHIQTLVTRGNHARCLGEAGDVAEAVRLLEELLEHQLRVLGPDHREVLIVRNNLASWEEDPFEALEQHQALLGDEVRVLGSDHAHILTTRENILHLTREIGTEDEINGAFEALLEDQAQILGSGHPEILGTRSDLAHHRGDTEAAAEYMRGLLSHRIDALGPDHPRTLTARHKLIGLQAPLSPVDEQVASREALFWDMERVFGSDHRNTLIARRELAFSRHLAGDTERAVAELEQLLTDLEPLSHTDVNFNVYFLLKDIQQKG